MARTNIEDSGFTKAMELAHEMGWEPTQALGALGWLWHESQDKLKLTGTGREIIRWSKLRLEDDEASAYLNALEDLDLIRRLNAGAPWSETDFDICGNEDEVVRIVDLKKKSKKGGESTRRKWEAEKARKAKKAPEEPCARPEGRPYARPHGPPNETSGQPSGPPQVGPTLRTDQFRSDQCSSVQISSEQEKQKTIAPARPVPAGVTREHIDRCKNTWLKTLVWAGQDRKALTQTEEELIVRAILANRSTDDPEIGWQIVELALFGAQHEPGFEGFNPKDNVDIARVLLPDREGRPRIQKFVGYGARAKKKEAELAARKATVDSLRKPPEALNEQSASIPDDSNADMSREEIRALVGGIYKGMRQTSTVEQRCPELSPPRGEPQAEIENASETEIEASEEIPTIVGNLKNVRGPRADWTKEPDLKERQAMLQQQLAQLRQDEARRKAGGAQ